MQQECKSTQNRQRIRPHVERCQQQSPAAGTRVVTAVTPAWRAPDTTERSQAAEKNMQTISRTWTM